MTAPSELIDPREEFLEQGRLPVETYVSPRSHHKHIARDLTIAVLIGVLAVRRHLAQQEPDVGRTQEQAREAWREQAPTWLQVVIPALREAYALGRVDGLTGQELDLLAADYANELGEYVNNTSAESLAAGMDAQLAGRWNEKLAWHRATSAYGLNKREMLGYIRASITQGEKTGELIPAAARAMADKALEMRAADIGDQEAYSAEQSGQAVAWIWLERTGRLAPGHQRGWLLGDTETHCATCLELHRQEVPLAEPFVLASGAKVWAPRAHPGCDCRVKLIPPTEKVSKDSGVRPPSGPTRSTTSCTVAGLCVRAADTGRVLMLQRALDPKDPAGGTWEFPGGHLEPGESPLEGAKREWEEEVGRRLPAGARARNLWRHGIYTGVVIDVPSESLVPSHRRGSVTNPDDPDRDQVEAIAWWDVAQLAGNPAVRPELRASMPKVRRALPSPEIGKAYDPREARDRRGRWAEVAERTRVEAPAPVESEPVNPLAPAANPLATRPANPLALGGNPLAVADPLATRGANLLAPAGNPLAGRKRRTIRSDDLRIVIIPPGQARPSRNEYYMEADDYYSAQGWNEDRKGVGDKVDFDAAQAAVPEQLQAGRGRNAWSPVSASTAEHDPQEQLQDHLWDNVVKAAKPARDEAMRSVREFTSGGHRSLDDGEIARIAALAGYSDEEDPTYLRHLIVKSAEGTYDDDGSLAAAYGDYMTFVRFGWLGENGEEVDRRLTDAFGTQYNGEEMIDYPRQVFAFGEVHPRTSRDELSMVPEQEYFVQGLVYHSAIGAARRPIPGLIGIQELQLKPLHARFGD